MRVAKSGVRMKKVLLVADNPTLQFLLTRQIESNPETKDTLIMATTVFYKGSDLRSCMEAGCTDYILKPFTFEELREKIQEYFP